MARFTDAIRLAESRQHRQSRLVLKDPSADNSKTGHNDPFLSDPTIEMHKSDFGRSLLNFIPSLN